MYHNGLRDTTEKLHPVYQFDPKMSELVYTRDMKDFHDYYFSLSPVSRQKLAERARTSIGYLERVAGGFALPSLRFAVVLSKASLGKTSVDAIVRTYERKHGKLA